MRTNFTEISLWFDDDYKIRYNYVQKLHILQKMARHTTHSIILLMQLFLLAIESTV